MPEVYILFTVVLTPLMPDNAIGGEGAVALGRALENLTQLTTLNLRSESNVYGSEMLVFFVVVDILFESSMYDHISQSVKQR